MTGNLENNFYFTWILKIYQFKFKGGFATVAGSVLAAYINLGIPANHLVVASLMAAPGALLVSKTLFPETKNTKADWKEIENMPKG